MAFSPHNKKNVLSSRQVDTSAHILLCFGSQNQVSVEASGS